jgi:molybdenum cofactor cytidylyltransferase
VRDKIDAVLLASGFSKRFGAADKLLAPFEGKPLARHTLDLVCGSAGVGVFKNIFFVVSHDEVACLAEGLQLTIIHNKHPERGQRESIRLGTGASAKAASGAKDVPPEYLMFFPCDQPLLSGEALAVILKARRRGCIVQPCFENVPGNPALFSSVFLGELGTLKDGEHGRDLIRRHPDSLVRVEVPPLSGRRAGLSPLIDIDDPQTLKFFLTE